MEIREARKEDLEQLLRLYTQFPDNPMPQVDNKLKALWNHMLADPYQHLIVGEINGRLITSCVVTIILNLTHFQKPYALVENVITNSAFRNNGYATAALDFAKELAEKEGCYKIMLLTGSKLESTLNFYRKAGYNSNDKTAFIQWLYQK